MPEDPNVHSGNAGDFVGPPIDAVPDTRDRGTARQWAMPLLVAGCGCIALPLLMIVLGLAGIGNTVRRLYKSTGTYQVYELASEAVETDTAVMETLGRPVEAGWTSKSTEVYNPDNQGRVCLRFNVSGGDRSGNAYAEAKNDQGAWQLYQLRVWVNGEPEPLAIVPLPIEQKPLCPDFDDPESESESESEDMIPESSDS